MIYLKGRIMHRIHNGDIILFQSYSKKNKEIHLYGNGK